MHAFLNNLANRQTGRQTQANAFTSSFVGGNYRDGVLEDCLRARGQLEDPKSWPWPWPLTVLALALVSKWSGLGLGLDASAFSNRSVINVLNL